MIVVRTCLVGGREQQQQQQQQRLVVGCNSQRLVFITGQPALGADQTPKVFARYHARPAHHNLQRRVRLGVIGARCCFRNRDPAQEAHNYFPRFSITGADTPSLDAPLLAQMTFHCGGVSEVQDERAGGVGGMGVITCRVHEVHAKRCEAVKF